MYLENVVFDARDPRRLGRFWEAALAGVTLTDEEAGYETHLEFPGGSALDFCFQPVPEPATSPQRLHLVLAPSTGLGKERTDAEGNPFLVAEEADGYDDTGLLAALRLEAADPEREGALWAWLTSWTPVPGQVGVSLRHPSLRGPLLEVVAEAGPKEQGKNRRHLDLRLEPGDDVERIEQRIIEYGGRRLEHDWGVLPWTSYVDGSGNELCLLASRG